MRRPGERIVMLGRGGGFRYGGAEVICDFPCAPAAVHSCVRAPQAIASAAHLLFSKFLLGSLKFLMMSLKLAVGLR